MVYRQSNNENSYQVRNTTERGYLSKDKYPAQNTDYIGKYICIRYRTENRIDINQRFHIPEGYYNDYTYPENSGLRNIFFRILRWDMTAPYRAILINELNEVIVTYTTDLMNDIYDLTDSMILDAVESRAFIKKYEYLKLNETSDPNLFFEKLCGEKVKVFPSQVNKLIGLKAWSEYDSEIPKDRSLDVLQYKNKKKYQLTSETRELMVRRDARLYGKPKANFESYPFYHNPHRYGKIDDSRRAVNSGIIIRADNDDFVEPEFVVMEISQDTGMVRFVTQHEANFYYIVEDYEAHAPENAWDIVEPFFNKINPGYEEEEEEPEDQEEENQGGEEGNQEEEEEYDDGLVPYENRLNVFDDGGERITATIDNNTNIETYSITTGGTFDISNNSNTRIHTKINIVIDTEEDVTLNLNNLQIDNSGFIADLDTITSVQDNNITISLNGNNILNNFKATNMIVPTNIISANGKIILEGETNSYLTLYDTNYRRTDYGEYEPINGISATGDIEISDINLEIYSAGLPLLTSGDIIINSGNISITGYLKEAIKCNNFVFNNGTLTSTSVEGTGIIVKENTTVNNGTININASGNGISTEFFTINSGNVNITTAYKYAGVNFYTANTVGPTNIISYENNTITEQINYNTGTFHGIVVGKEEYTFENRTTGLEPEVDIYSASGGIDIKGGIITIDTKYSGIIYDSDDDHYIIGAPGVGIYSYTYVNIINNATVNITSAGNGIHADENLNIFNNAVVNINESYEGLEAANITIGNNFYGEPTVYVISNEDGINSSSANYRYIVESTKQYKITELIPTGNDITVNKGDVIIKINDTQTHNIILRVYNSTKQYMYNSDGDGFDCDGSLYLNGGKIYVYGATGNSSNTPIDVVENFEIKSGVTLFAIGLDPFSVAFPTNTEQAYITTGSPRTNGEYKNIKPGTLSVTGTGVSIALQVPTKANIARFFLFTIPGMINNIEYAVISSGTNLGEYKGKM